jgi:hypothetical protein
MDTINKCGHFQDYNEAQALYVAQKEAAKQAKADLAFLDGVSEGSEKSKKSSKKAKEAKATAEAADPEMQANFMVDFNKAKVAAENAKSAMTIPANKMFGFYTNLLSVEAKYAWNKIVTKQTASDPKVDLQGISQKGPRGVSSESFDCVLFHLLTMFPINAAEQEKFNLTNVLKKPQCVSVHQFVRRVEQLNAYIAQMPCLYNSPSANATTILVNIPFTEAELGSHVLWMCPLQWQDQYNLHKKGMMPLDMCLLLRSLEAIESVCTQEKASAQSKKGSTKGKKSNKPPGTEPTARVPKKACTKKHCNLCKMYGGAHTTHNTRFCCKYDMDRKEKSNFGTAKKGRKKPNPVKIYFAQLRERLDKLENVLKKLSKKSKKCHYEDSDSNSE